MVSATSFSPPAGYSESSGLPLLSYFHLRPFVKTLKREVYFCHLIDKQSFMLLMCIFFRSVINNSTVFAVAGTRQVPCFVLMLVGEGKLGLFTLMM